MLNEQENTLTALIQLYSHLKNCMNAEKENSQYYMTYKEWMSAVNSAVEYMYNEFASSSTGVCSFYTKNNKEPYCTQECNGCMWCI